MRIEWQPRISIVIFIAAVCAIVLILIFGLRLIATSNWTGTSRQLTPSPKAADTLPAAPVPPLPPCPPAGVPALQPSTQTGHHKVILSWNASATTPDHDSQPVGYCLYRSTKQNAAKQNPTCSECERVNAIPVVGTGCVDDLVTDGTTYYYVATAINEKKKISSSSNEIRAQIPLNKQTANGVPASSYPLCRAGSQ